MAKIDKIKLREIIQEADKGALNMAVSRLTLLIDYTPDGKDFVIKYDTLEEAEKRLDEVMDDLFHDTYGEVREEIEMQFQKAKEMLSGMCL